MFDFYRTVARDALVTAGVWKIGIVNMQGSLTYFPVLPPNEVLPAVATQLRKAGADIVIAVCSGYELYWLGACEALAGNGADVLVLPVCADCARGSLRWIRGTWILPNLNNGALRYFEGRAFVVVDFDLAADDKLRPVLARQVNVTALPPALAGTPEYLNDVSWLQAELDATAENDPIVGEASSALPHGRVLSGEEVVDEVCRRDACHIGVLFGKAIREFLPAIDIVWVNGGLYRRGWDAGPITMSELFGAAPYDNTLCLLKTTATDLWEHLVRATSYVNSDGTWQTGSPESGAFAQTNGLIYEYDPARPDERIIRMEVVNRETGVAEPVDRKRLYSVATTSFLCGGGDFYESWKEHNATPSQVSVQQVLQVYLEKHRPYELGSVPSIVKLGDPRPSISLRRMKVGDCGVTERYLPEWEMCEQCDAGMIRDQERTGCVAAADASGVALWTVLLVLGLVGGAAAVLGLLAWWKLTEEKRRLARLYDDTAVAQQCAEAIADMELEKVLTFLQANPNPNRIQIAFNRIIKNLMLYRPFLPRSVLSKDPSCTLEGPDESASVPAPSGWVALCFTDIIGSTALWEASPEGMEEALNMHNKVIRNVFAKYGGYEVKTIGDSFMVAFQDPVNAMLFAVQVQEDLLDAQWVDDLDLADASPYWSTRLDAAGNVLWRGLAVRIGLAYGEARDEINPVTERVDYRGPTVNLAARCEAGAPDGTVCVNEAAVAFSDDARLRDVRFELQPPKMLKGIGVVQTHVITRDRLLPRLMCTTSNRVNVLTPEGRPRSASVMDRMTRSSHSRDSSGELRRSTSSSTQIKYNPDDLHCDLSDDARFQVRLQHGVGSVAQVSALDGSCTLYAAGFQGRTAKQVTFTINTTLQQCVVCAARTQGKIGTVSGTSALVDWNVGPRCPNHQTQAVIFARYLSAGTLAVPTLRIGLSSGDLLKGNAGTKLMKGPRFPIVAGVPTHTAAELCRVGAQIGVHCLAAFLPEPPSCTFDGGRTRPVDVWCLQAADSSADTRLVVRELILRTTSSHGGRYNDAASRDVCFEASSPCNIGECPDPFEQLFWAAMRGSAEAAQGIVDTAEQTDDPVGCWVGAQLQEHVRRHPEGGETLREAPFYMGPAGVGMS
eukprot:TRINITY_DN1561_c4_g1_i1.p1 TRINITY_DN1561_c4_g1~~TRINITY_DN1561_c4_g1_i1.p1  ORF type:complete len:1280 (+),score=257.36 TRINITY_DN1561_c4_g1_i1:475-3840(+)